MKSAASAAESATVATMFISAVAKVAQVKSGIRVHVMPGARILMIVTMKFKPVIVELMPMRKIATHHQLVPGGPCSETGAYSVQPASGAPYRYDKNKIAPEIGKIQKLSMLSQGKATS